MTTIPVSPSNAKFFKEHNLQSYGSTISTSDNLALQVYRRVPTAVPQKEGIIIYVNDRINPPRILVSIFTGTYYIWGRANLVS